MLGFRQVEAFRAVMRTGSMTEAANVLGTSQPGVSRLIAQLEASTKLKLFSRGGGRLEPTAEAVAFNIEVERSFSGLQVLEQAACDIRNFGTGHLRIACLPALALGFMPRVIKRFADSYPDIRISLQARSSSTVYEWTASQQCDFGVAARGPDFRGVEAKVFMSTAGICVLPARHRLAGHKVIHPTDLAGERFISLGLSDTTRAKIDTVFAEANVQRLTTFETQYAATICAAVIEGLGVSIVHQFTAPDFLSRGIVVKPFKPEIQIDDMLLFPANKSPSRLTEKFIEAMESCRDEQLAAWRRSETSTGDSKRTAARHMLHAKAE
jgi:DNA-binding transcriptional LysR family regulator